MNLKEQLAILGENIQTRRRDQALTRRELAERIDVHESYIIKIEQGLRQPSINVVMKIADVLYIKDWRRLLYGRFEE